jgi:hypothetical protein
MALGFLALCWKRMSALFFPFKQIILHELKDSIYTQIPSMLSTQLNESITYNASLQANKEFGPDCPLNSPTLAADVYS